MLPDWQRYGLFAVGITLGIGAFFLLDLLGMKGQIQYAAVAFIGIVVPSALLSYLQDDDEITEVRTD